MKRSSLNFIGYEPVWDYPKTDKPTLLSKVNGVKPSASSHLQSKTSWIVVMKAHCCPWNLCLFSCFTHHNSSQHLGVDFLHSSAKNMSMYDGAVTPLLEVADLQSTEKPNCRERCQSFFSQVGCFRKLLQPTNSIYERRAT